MDDASLAFEHRAAGNNVLSHFHAHLHDLTHTTHESLGLVRLLDEIHDDLSARAWRLLAEDDEVNSETFEARLLEMIATQGLAGDITEAKMSTLDSLYANVDATVKDLDRRIRLVESLLRAQGRAIVEESAPPARQRHSDSDALSHADAAAAASRGRAHSAPTHRSAAAAAAARSMPMKHSSKHRSVDASPAALARILVANALSGATRTGKPRGAAHADADAFEPVYCSCQQVAFGEMIACDAEDCPVQWYHCQCVGETGGQIGGAWFCPSCKARRDAGSKR